MLLLISDANVLIDIEYGELTQTMFSLPFQFAVPDILFEEELFKQHNHLLSMGLKKQEMSGDLISEAYNLRQQEARISLNDLLTLILAKNSNSLLLTGDKALRILAEKHGIEVHGVIWLVEKMIECGKVTIEQCSIAFQKMKSHGSRLPWMKVDELLTRQEIVT